jgi:hypothetical protein
MRYVIRLGCRFSLGAVAGYCDARQRFLGECYLLALLVATASEAVRALVPRETAATINATPSNTKGTLSH